MFICTPSILFHKNFDNYYVCLTPLLDKQSTNQPINQSTNQPINQSTNQPIMPKCPKVQDILCNECQKRGVKIKPRQCLPKESYMSCHLLCRPCWDKCRWDNYDSDKHKNKNYPHCYKCSLQLCSRCYHGYGEWYPDIQKVLCYSCL